MIRYCGCLAILVSLFGSQLCLAEVNFWEGLPLEVKWNIFPSLSRDELNVVRGVSRDGRDEVDSFLGDLKKSGPFELTLIPSYESKEALLKELDSSTIPMHWVKLGKHIPFDQLELALNHPRLQDVIFLDFRDLRLLKTKDFKANRTPLFQMLSKLKKLQYIDFKNTYVRADHLTELKKSLPRLTGVRVRFNWAASLWTDIERLIQIGIYHIFIAPMPFEEELENGSEFLQFAMDQVTRMNLFGKVHLDLDLSTYQGSMTNGQGNLILSNLLDPQDPSQWSLSLTSCGDDFKVPLSTIFKSNRISHLSISHPCIGVGQLDQVLSEIAEPMPHLKALEIKMPTFFKDWLGRIGTRFPNLVYLDVGGARFTDRSKFLGDSNSFSGQSMNEIYGYAPTDNEVKILRRNKEVSEVTAEGFDKVRVLKIKDSISGWKVLKSATQAFPNLEKVIIENMGWRYFAASRASFDFLNKLKKLRYLEISLSNIPLKWIAKILDAASSNPDLTLVFQATEALERKIKILKILKGYPELKWMIQVDGETTHRSQALTPANTNAQPAIDVDALSSDVGGKVADEEVD